MAININELFVNALLKMMERKKLSSVTIQDLLDETGASRQTFYNHFKDKNDLVCYIYNNRIIPDYRNADDERMNFKASLLSSFYHMKEYYAFLNQALRDESAGNLNIGKQFDILNSLRGFENEKSKIQEEAKEIMILDLEIDK